MKRLIITVCFSLSLSTVSIGMSWSGDYQKGLDAAQSGNYIAALKEWRPLAEQGHIESQFVLGLLYRNGKGVEKDFSTAIKWYLLAAENGHAKAQAKLGYMYVNGEGVNKNYVRAYMWGRLSEINENREGSELKRIMTIELTAAKIEEAERLVRECMKKDYKGC